MLSVTQDAIDCLISSQSLPETYGNQLLEFIVPMAEQLATQARQYKPLLLGIQGSQGSGKSTLALFLSTLFENEFELETEICSIDDFYLSRQTRQNLAQTVHPLLKTRGVPGTHDIDLLASALESFKGKQAFTLPRFNKATDDLLFMDQWNHVTSKPDILILEGWCVGIEAQASIELAKPVNNLESEEDPNGDWRNFVNQRLRDHYSPVFDMLDKLIVIQAPSFECVYDWRAEQEAKLVSSLKQKNLSADKTLSEAQLKRFIHHFQRLTEHGLKTLPSKADYVLNLNAEHCFVGLDANANSSER